jgi:hypothetical protein
MSSEKAVTDKLNRFEDETTFDGAAKQSLIVPSSVFGSLIPSGHFPDTSKKYPVLMRREFGRKRLIYISENERPARFGGQIRENSLYFPGYQGILAAETSSSKTASTAS